MKNTHISLSDFKERVGARLISGAMVFSIVISQALLPYTAIAAAGIYVDTANANMTKAVADLVTASSTLGALNKSVTTAESGLLTTALNQGLTTEGISLKQITDASKIVPEDALRLATTMINEGIAAGAMNMTQLINGGEFDDVDAEAIVLSAFRDSVPAFGWDVDRSLDTDDASPICTGGGVGGGDAGGDATPLVCEPTASVMEGYIESSLAALQAAPTPLTVASAKRAIVSKGPFQIQLVADPGPQVCTGGGWGGPDNGGWEPIVCLPKTQAELETLALAFTSKMGSVTIQNAIQKTITNRLAADIIGASGVLDEAAYKTLFANSIIASTGVGDAVKLKASLGNITFVVFQDVVKNAIHADIINQVNTLSENYISPTALDSAIDTVANDQTTILGKNIRDVATQSVSSAIAGGAVSLTGLNNLAMVNAVDMKKIVSGALLDTGLTATPAQLNLIVSGSLDSFLAFDGKADIAKMQGLIGGQIGSVLNIPVANFLPQMGAGTLQGLQGAITNVMTENVVASIGSLSGGLSVAGMQTQIANSILSTTGSGVLSNVTINGISSTGITDILSNAATGLNITTLTSIQGGIQGIVNGQLGQLTTALNPANMQNLISAQISGLTGFGNPAGVLASINPSLTSAFSSVALIDGQLGSITSQFTNAFDGSTLGLSSLTSTLNPQLAGLTDLAQFNLAGLSTDVGSLVGGLTGGVTGQLSGALGGLSGVTNGIMANGLASVADLGSLTGALGGLTGGLTTMLPMGGGVAAIAGLGGVVGLSGMSELPFGGKIVRSKACTVTPGWQLIYLDSNYAGSPATSFMYQPGSSVMFANRQIYRRGPYVIGLYSPVTLPCMVWTWKGPRLKGTGQLITMIGTSR